MSIPARKPNYSSPNFNYPRTHTHLLSEGIDFSDELARAVFIVGVPYPPFLDKRVKSK